MVRVENKNSKIIVLLVIVLSIAICGCITYVVLLNKTNKTNSDSQSVLLDSNYTISYDDMTDPGNKYEILISKDINITVIKTSYSSISDTTPTKKTYEVKFSNEAKKKIKEDYIPTVFGDSKNITIIDSMNFQENNAKTSLLINAIILNDESTLMNSENNSSEDSCKYSKVKDIQSLSDSEKDELIALVTNNKQDLDENYPVDIELIGSYVYEIRYDSNCGGKSGTCASATFAIVWKENNEWKYEKYGSGYTKSIGIQKNTEIENSCKK